MTVVKLEIMKGNPICLFIFVLISLLIGTSDNLTFAGYNVYQSQSVMNGMSEFVLANVEALAGGEDNWGCPNCGTCTGTFYVCESDYDSPVLHSVVFRYRRCSSLLCASAGRMCM